ncbi:putative vacuolar protein sorting-associated protein Ist1 [Helianthus annuus]|nr:putative vacuolar protein sorting-associated protein Ist1 [Helianthus annuus]
MLNKRFKIAKCKTSLKLATSRIKLMRNKKGVQINQMKRELAQLLESGQDRTARIRVEHVIREEKMVAAYDLIEIYCELIVARLPIIESQKTCPIDLKEAITSVIFAAPRCSDIPELADVKKNFTAKYGKEFVSAAIELRPDCGVSRMLVEKLSAVAPDVQTKVKVLSAVAKEYNVNWDPTSFEEKESKPPDDLLNGPTYIEKPSTISVDSPKIQTSYAQNVQSHEENPNGRVDFAQQNRRFTLDAQNVPTADSTHDDMGPSGLGSGTMNTRHSFNSSNNSSFSKETWNMEFKDATSAAQAAAESAERASIAARAAAMLSSQGKITRQYSSESYSSQQNPRVSSEYTGQHSFKDTYNNTSFKDRKSKIQNQQMGPMGPTGIDTSLKATKSSSSLRSRNDSIKDNSVNYFETHETSSTKESRARFTNGGDGGSSKSANVDYYGNERDDLSFDQRKAGQRKVVDQENESRDVKYDVHEDDESDSDAGPRFDTGFEYDEVDAKAFFPSPDRESFSPLESPKSTFSDTKKSTFVDQKNTSSTMGRVGSAKSVDHSVKYDLSDGPGSETETETTKSTSRVDPGFVEPPPSKVNPTKSRIELNDLVETGSSIDNEYDDFDTGKDLKFGTLTGGLRHKSGLKYPPYTKTAVKESPVKVDPASKQSSFSSRTSKADNTKPSVVSKSESDSDSDDNNETLRLQNSFKTRSQFAPPDKFFNNDESDFEEEVSSVSKPMSTGKVRLGPGLSRRTKGQVEPMGKTVISNSSPSSSTSAERKSNTRFNITESPPKPQPDPARFTHEPFRTKPDPKISEPPPNPRIKIVESVKAEPPKTVNLSSETKQEANNVKKPSHVHPKLPEYDSLAARIQALSKMNR